MAYLEWSRPGNDNHLLSQDQLENTHHSPIPRPMGELAPAPMSQQPPIRPHQEPSLCFYIGSAGVEPRASHMTDQLLHLWAIP